MSDKYIAGEIRRANQTLLLTNLAILSGVLLIAAVCHRYLINALFGPAAFPKRLLRADANVQSEYYYYVKIKADGAGEIGEEVFRRVDKQTGKVRSEVVSAKYAILHIEGWLIVAKLGTSDPVAPEMIGALVPLSVDQRSTLIAPVTDKEAHLQGRFMPFLLDTTGFRTPLYIGLAVGLPLAAFCLWNMKRARDRSWRPDLHPIYRSLERFGKPDEVDDAITRELDGDGVISIGRVTLSPSWILIPGAYTLTVIPTSQLLWIYMKTVQRSVNFISNGQTFTAVICHLYGSKEVQGAEDVVQRLLKEMLARAPWALIGYDQERERLWFNSAGIIVQEVEQRRQKILEGQPGSGPVPAGDEGPAITSPTT